MTVSRECMFCGEQIDTTGFYFELPYAYFHPTSPDGFYHKDCHDFLKEDEHGS